MLCEHCGGTGNIRTSDGMRVSHFCGDCEGRGFIRDKVLDRIIDPPDARTIADATPENVATPGAGGAGNVDREAVKIWSRELAAELFAQPHVHQLEAIERHLFAAVQAVAHARTCALLAERDALQAAVEKIVNNWDDLHPKDLRQARAALARVPAAEKEKT
jgi:hypothetical protein